MTSVAAVLPLATMMGLPMRTAGLKGWPLGAPTTTGEPGAEPGDPTGSLGLPALLWDRGCSPCVPSQGLMEGARDGKDMHSMEEHLGCSPCNASQDLMEGVRDGEHMHPRRTNWRLLTLCPVIRAQRPS